MIILGSGNMATNLAMAFHKSGVAIRCVYSPTPEHAEKLAHMVGCDWTSDLASLPQDEVYVYAVRDAVLHDLLLQVDAPDALHLHTAGSMGMTVFEGTNKLHAGVFYPFQSVSKDRVLDFQHIPVFVETAQAEDMPKVKALASEISEQVYEADSDMRCKLHLAGVFANNFTNCMYAIGEQLLTETGLPREVLLSLIDETAAKVHQLPARQAQTGPAMRYDENVMARHLSMLEDENLKQIYQLISKNIHDNA